MSDLLNACEAFHSLNANLSSGGMSDEDCLELIEARNDMLDEVLELEPQSEPDRYAKIHALIAGAEGRAMANGDLRTAEIIACLRRTFNQKFSSPLPSPAASQGAWNSFSP